MLSSPHDSPFILVKTSGKTGRCVGWLSGSVSGIRESVSCENGVFEVIELVGLETGQKKVILAEYRNELVFRGN